MFSSFFRRLWGKNQGQEPEIMKETGPYSKAFGQPAKNSRVKRDKLPLSIPEDISNILIDKVYGRTDERDRLWSWLEPHLKEFGYRIAWNGDTEHKSDKLPPPADPWNPRPGESLAFAVLGRDGTRWGGPTFWPTLSGAFDPYDRFVILKMVETNSNELAILRELMPTPNRPRHQHNHTIPVLDIVSWEDWSFIVMPSWEVTVANSPPCVHVREYIDIAVQCFEGLAHMHSLQIAHLDVYSLNIVLNHVCNSRGDSLAPFFNLFPAKLAFIDFDRSIKFPPNMPLTSCLVHNSVAPMTYARIPGVRDAHEKMFNPFLADIYALAVTVKDKMTNDEHWCKNAWKTKSVSLQVPFEVPEFMDLLEELMHPIPEYRPTALEALQRLRIIRDRLS